MQEHIQALLDRLPQCHARDYPLTAPTFQNEYGENGEVVCIRHRFDDDPDTHAVAFTVDLLDDSDVIQIVDTLIHVPGVTLNAFGHDPFYTGCGVVVCRVVGHDPALAF